MGCLVSLELHSVMSWTMIGLLGDPSPNMVRGRDDPTTAGSFFLSDNAEQFFSLFADSLFYVHAVTEFADEGLDVFTREVLVCELSTAQNHLDFYLVTLVEKAASSFLTYPPVVLTNFK